MLSSDYLADAKKLILLSSPHIKASMTPEEAVQGALLFALGIEKLLKYLLAEINPIFILKIADFKHSAPSLYSDRIVSTGKTDEIDTKPDSDVITFRISLSRSKVFSKVANKYSQLLFTLAHWRDIIAHRPTSELDLVKVELMLKKDAVPLIREFSEEQNISLSDFFGSEETRLSELSQQLTNREQFETEMNQLLANHKTIWEHRSANAELISQANDLTSSLLKHSGVDFAYDEVPCPACGNLCVIRIEPDYDYADGESYLSGVYAEQLHCYYCGLNMDTYEALDFVDVDGLLANVYEDA